MFPTKAQDKTSEEQQSDVEIGNPLMKEIRVMTVKIKNLGGKRMYRVRNHKFLTNNYKI